MLLFSQGREASTVIEQLDGMSVSTGISSPDFKPHIGCQNLAVTGLPPHSGGVACALGPWGWTNNSTDLLDIKYIIHLLSVVASIKGKEQHEADGTRSKEREDSTIEYKIHLANS